MSNVFKKFYRSFYNRTNGFIPTKPLNQNMYPGDFFQIRNGEMIVLGNIFRNKVVSVDECEFENGITLNPNNWNFSEGVSKPYSGRDQVQNPLEGQFKFNKQVLAFNGFGSFFFSSNNVESVRIVNWSEIQQELIIKLTQIMYSFRELYVVTECAVASDWALAIAGTDAAELEITTESENFGLVDLFGNGTSKTIQARDIEFHHRETKKKPSFFKAKKLVVQQEKLDVFISELIGERTKNTLWATNFFEYNFHENDTDFSTPVSTNAQACLLDMLQANELNPNTALLYFRWGDASLDDIEKMFLVYGY